MITFDGVSKVFPDGTPAVCDLSLEVAEGETFVLLGTSGSGKTTSMKMVNRLIEPTGGRVLVAGQDIMQQDVISLRRNIGYAIQHIGLFPHMTVGENIAVVPRLLEWSSSRIDGRIDELLELVGLESADFRNRYPSQLSGGQLQRVGVARALAADPPVVLMDEPFGALDPITREQLQNEFLRLESILNKTIIFVTHDIFEAVRMGDRIALLDGGKLQQLGTPRELVENPANAFVDQFLGQHRFQLSLLTRRVKTILQDSAPPSHETLPTEGMTLSDSCTLIEALNVFKKSGNKRMTVTSGSGKAVGDLTRQQLLASIMTVFDDTEGGAA